MRIYLAGPDVFLPDAAAIAAEKKAICASHGAIGIFPTDPIDDPAAEAASERWYEIYLRNEAHIRACDAMIANLTPFRGPSADAGTVYEVGFMRALGRPVAGYTNSAEDFSRRTRAFLGQAARTLPEGGWVDGEGLQLESFGCHDNLMIDGGIRASGAPLVARAVPEARRWRDLTAFEACLVSLMRGKFAA